MIKKLFFIALILFVCAGTVLFIFKNTIATHLVNSWLKSSASSDSGVTKVSVSLRQVRLENVVIAGDGVSLNIPQAQLDYRFIFPRTLLLKNLVFTRPNLRLVNLEDALVFYSSFFPPDTRQGSGPLIEFRFAPLTLVLSDYAIIAKDASNWFIKAQASAQFRLTSAQELSLTSCVIESFTFSNKDFKVTASLLSAEVGHLLLLGEYAQTLTGPTMQLPQLPNDFKLAFSQAKISAKGPSGLSFTTEASLSLSSRDGAPYLDALSLAGTRFESEMFKTNFSIIQNGELYSLHFKKPLYKDKKLEDITVPLRFSNGELIIEETSLPLLGPLCRLSGGIKPSSFQAGCARIAISAAEFTPALDILDYSKDVAFQGKFSGALDACFKGNQIESFESTFSSVGPGMINIHREIALDFLKQYLDDSSYAATIDSFNNYSYNNGAISVSKSNDTYGVQFEFNSEKFGKRSIAVNYHTKGGE